MITVPPNDLTLIWGDTIAWLKPDPSLPAATLKAGATVTFSGTYEPYNLGEFVRIEAGNFLMGVRDNPGWSVDADEMPEHEVTISSDFWLGATEVTQAQYGAVMGVSPVHNLDCRNCPVSLINWYDAVHFCNAASVLAGYDQVYTIGSELNDPVVTWNRTASGYRLPTEAEWEYAARREVTYRFCADGALANTAWYDENSDGVAHPVGELAGCLGLYDIHGNISEFCWDWFGSYGADPQIDPAGPQAGTRKISRVAPFCYPPMIAAILAAASAIRVGGQAYTSTQGNFSSVVSI